MTDLDLDELYGELEEFQSSKKSTSSRTPREERIIAGFEDIERFVEQHGRLPTHGEDKDIFERLYAVRLRQNSLKRRMSISPDRVRQTWNIERCFWRNKRPS
jgi:hypothetical protein